MYKYGNERKRHRTPPNPHPPTSPTPLPHPPWPLAPLPVTPSTSLVPPAWPYPPTLHPTPEPLYPLPHVPPTPYSHCVETAARKQSATQEILLLTTPSETRMTLQTLRCNELLGLVTATCASVSELYTRIFWEI